MVSGTASAGMIVLEHRMQPGRVIAERYRITEPLARGGMGEVWIAEHTQLGSRVAVKFMDPELLLEPVLRARFEREAKAAASLNSPHVIQIHDYGFDRGVPFMAMELLEGEDLADRLERVYRIAPAAVAKIVRQVCKALRQAHRSGIVHRDLKPANVFLCRDEDDEVVKVLDFGIAKETGFGLSGTSSKVTSAREVLGSPAYISPEQIRSPLGVDARTDLWSLGVMIYEMLTGELPFDSETPGDLLAKILIESPQLATVLVPELPAELDDFFERALARDPAQRFQTAREMSDAFVEASGLRQSSPDLSDPGLAAPPSSSSVLDPTSNSDTKATLVKESERGRAHTADKFQTNAARTMDIVPIRKSRGWVVALSAALALGGGLIIALMTANEPEVKPAAEPIKSEQLSETVVAEPAAPAEEAVEDVVEPPSPEATASATVAPSASAAPAASLRKPFRLRTFPQKPAVKKPQSDVLGF
jgi:serine/threonine protein kinase